MRQFRPGEDIEKYLLEVSLESAAPVQQTVETFIPPRLTTAERDAITSPTTGMVIYNTTTGALNVYTSSWGAV